MDTLLDFLKKHSDVDIEFIKDFIAIQNGDKTHAPFNIDLDVITKWLNSRKEDIKKTLMESYTKNIDYILLRPRQEQNTHGGNNREIILLTPDCFKMLCMRSKTKKANKIREYYIALEKLVIVYKDDIIELQQQKIDRLQNDLRKNKYPVKGALYALRVGNGIKIGKTTNLNNRLKLYNNAHENNPEVLYVFYTSDVDRLENCVKNVLRYEAYRDKKEFFVLDLVDIVGAIDDCDKLIINFKCKSCKHVGKIGDFKSHINDKHKKNEKIKLRRKIT